MIYDNLSEIELYKGLSDDIYEGLTYLKQIKPDIEVGVYQISTRVKALVSEYETKKVNEYGYEAHKRFIDIQCVLQGNEQAAYLPIEGLRETKPYNEEIDATFYFAGTNPQPSYLNLQPSYFAIFFPQDSHMPQLCIDEPQMVKKVVVKVKIEKN